MARVSPPNKLLSQSCSCYHMSRKLPGKLQKTSLSQPFFPAKKGRYAWKVGHQFPRGDSSYHTRPRPAYQELPRASAGVKINKSSLKSARSAHTTELATCNAHATLRRPARPPGFLVFSCLPARPVYIFWTIGNSKFLGFPCFFQTFSQNLTNFWHNFIFRPKSQ